jgi:hypothetical protein
VPDSPLLLESSTLINLAASRELSSIVDALGRPVVVCDAAHAECLLPSDLSEGPLIRANLDDLFQINALIRCVGPCAGEEELFVELATMLDDAEAMAVAIATRREYGLASDDAKVRSVFEQQVGSGARLLSTPSLLQHWAECGRVPHARAREAVKRIAADARFRPHKDDSSCAWWERLVA